MFSPIPPRAAAAAAVIVVITITSAHAQEPSDTVSVREEMAMQAQQLQAFVRSEVARDFLDAASELPPVADTRVVHYNKTTRSAIADAKAAKMSENDLDGYERHEVDERMYYYTFYGSPLAFVRPLDLLGRAGFESLDGARVADFGFGSIGQLRLMAANGADAHGIEVSEFLRVLYDHPLDTGRVVRAKSAGVGGEGSVSLHFGQWPAEESLVRDVDGRFDVFISKNTLKNGYIHPAEEVDPRMLVHLGVDDETFVRSVYNALAPGGFFMIYNLCPPQQEDRYIPWADGTSPFTRELLEETGFTVLAYNEDDSDAARRMGRLLGWDASMDLEKDLFGTYTLMRK